jgi:hypothetical protein
MRLSTIIQANAQTAIHLVSSGQTHLSIIVVLQIVYPAMMMILPSITIQDNVHSAMTQAVAGLIQLSITADLLIANHVIQMTHQIIIIQDNAQIVTILVSDG